MKPKYDDNIKLCYGFTDQNNNALEIEDNVNIYLIINTN